MSPTPYQFQIENVRKIMARPDRRFWVLDDPGLGKSVTACLAAREAGVRRMLVIAPASVRSAWVDRVVEWLPGHSVAALVKGRRKADSKPETWRQDMLRTADVIVVSPELLDEIPEVLWGLIVIDELQEYVSWRGKAVRQIADLLALNPAAYVLGLSATPCTAEPINTWTLLHLFWPGKWGEPRKNGEPPYRFLAKFANEVIGYEDRVSFKGLRADNADLFRQVIASHSTRTRREELGDILPPVDFRPFVIDLDDKRPDISHIIDKLDILTKESKHVAVFTWHKERAAEIYEKLAGLPRYRDRNITYVDGNTDASARAAVLAGHGQRDVGVLVATIGAVGTGIDLTFIDQYLIAEPIATAHYIIQLDGRFRRLSRLNTPAIGFMLFREGRDDDTRRTIVERMEAYSKLFAASKGDVALLDGIRAAKSPDDLWRRLGNLAANFTGMTADDLNDGSDAEEDWSI